MHSYGGYGKGSGKYAGSEEGGPGKRRSTGGFSEDELLNKRHRTRGALSKMQMTPETILYFSPTSQDGDGSSDEDYSSDEEEKMPQYRPGTFTQPIEIPVIRTLSVEEMSARDDDEEAGMGGGEDYPDDDAWYAKLHLVFELKEQALREQWLRAGGGGQRKLVQKRGPVSSTELLLAPQVESKLSKEDHLMVLGKMDAPEVPEERLKEIEGKLNEVQKTYEMQDKKFTRYYLHTQWAPQVIIDKPPVVATTEEGGAPPPKPRLLLKLKRLEDKK